MSLQIHSPAASFLQFGDVASQFYQKEYHAPLIEKDKWNVAFQFSVSDDAPVPLTTVLKAAICGYDGVFKTSLGICKPLFNRTHIIFADDSINLVSIVVGSTGYSYNRLITRSELIDILIGIGIVSYDEGSYLWYKEASQADLVINYLDEDNIAQVLPFERYLDTLCVDIDTAMTSDIAVSECFRYGITLADNAVVAVSNAVKRVENEKYLALIRYRSNENSMVFDYEYPSFYNRISIPAYILEPQYPSQRKVYKKSNGVLKVLSAVLEKEWQFQSDWIPDWLHQAMVVAMHHDIFQMNIKGVWESMVPDADYKIEWAEDNTDKGQATIKLKQGVYNYKNDSVGFQLSGCLPPYFKVVSVSTEQIVFELYPTINCQEFDFRFRESGSEDWSPVVVLEASGFAPYQFTFDLTPFPFSLFEYQFRSKCSDGNISEWGMIREIGTAPCSPVGFLFGMTSDLTPGQVGEPYNYAITLIGTPPFSLNSLNKPAWMNIAVSGSQVIISGTPTETGTDIPVEFNITNCSGANTRPFAKTIDIEPEAGSGDGIVYLELTECGGATLTLKDENENLIDIVAGDCSSDQTVPFGTYRIQSIVYEGCAGTGGVPHIIPALGTYFSLDSSNPTILITVNCMR